MQQEYELIRQKYNLPKYEDLDNEFEINQIEQDSFLLAAIRKKMVDKFEWVSNIIADIISPTAESITIMHECKYFDTQDKIELFNSYKRLQFFIRLSHELELMRNENNDADFIANISKEWIEMKEKIHPHFTKLKNSWTTDTVEIDDKRYFG